MSHHVQEQTAFLLQIDDRPGALGKVTGDLRGHALNLRALWAWSEDEGQTAVLFIPDRPEAVSACECDTCCAAEPLPVLWVSLTDRVGALDECLAQIADAKINIKALQALAENGQAAAVLQFADHATLQAAAQALGA
ncbi:MAG TPA: hypothetical protein VGM19_15060 [Armatimonadota bacterium]|jgi:hypothetical protein